MPQSNPVSSLYLFRLPLRLAPRHKLLQNTHHLLQRRDLPLHRALALIRAPAQFLIKVLPVRRGGHGGAEDRFYDEAVVRL